MTGIARLIIFACLAGAVAGALVHVERQNSARIDALEARVSALESR